MSWKKVTLKADEIAKGVHYQLQNEFEEVFVASGSPRGAALFTNRSYREPYEYYFSPDAIAIFNAGLIKWMAKTCSQPDAEAVALLVGHSDARQSLLMSAPDAAD